MTTATTSAPTGLRIRVRHGATIASIAGAVALNAFGIWGDGTPGAEDDRLVSFLVDCGFIAIGAALVFGLAVPRGLKRLAATGRAGTGAVVLSVLALLLVVPAFWTGLPPVLAVGGIVLGLAGRTATRGGLAIAATVVGLLAIVGDVAIYIADWMNTNGVL
jgi:hypothetical protein